MRELAGVPWDSNKGGSQILQGFSDAVQSLMTGVSGAGWPTENLQIGLRATNNTTKRRGVWNGSNWLEEGPNGVDASSFEWHISIGALSATKVLWLPVPRTGIVIETVAVISDTTTASSDGSNKWTLQVANVTAALNLFATAPTTFGSEIVLSVPWIQTADQNNTAIAAGVALQLTLTKTGSPTSLTNAAVTVRGYRRGV